MINFLHTFEPSPILATIGPFTLYWYGFFYTVSIILGYWLVRRSILQRANHTAHSLLSQSLVSNSIELDTRLIRQLPELTFGLIVSGIIGARIYHILNEWPYYWAHPLQTFAIWNGGLAIHGALMAGLIFLWLYSKKLKKQNPELRTWNTAAYSSRLIAGDLTTTRYSLPTTHCFLWLTDLLAPAILLGQAIGRWGNYFNQELFGYPTNLPWGIPISPASRPPAFTEFTYFHPTFLYESLWDFVGFIVLYILQRKIIKKNKLGGGIIFFIYIIYASIGRIFVEFFRIDTVPILSYYRLPAIMSFAFITTGILVLTRHTNKRYT